MTDSSNPFGGFDLGAMLEQAQQMQEQLVQAQQELALTTVDGTAGGVTVTLDGTGGLSAVTVPPDTFDGADAESLADLGDLVVAAYRDAKGRVDDLAAQALGPLAGGAGGLDLGGALSGLGELGGASGGDPGDPGDEPRRSGF